MKKHLKVIGQLIILAGVGINASSCNYFKQDEREKGEAVARVYDRLLYQEDVRELVPKELSGNDSLAFVQNYINAWAKDQLMLYKAEYNLTESQKNFEDQIAEYRRDLLKFAYRQEYIRQKLDTAVSSQDLEQHFEESKDNYLLNEHILRASYMVVRNEAPNLDDAVDWFLAGDSAASAKAENYALQYAFRFKLNEKSWQNFEQVAKQLNLQDTQAEEFLAGKDVRNWSDSVNTYLMRIHEYRLRGDQAPLSYVDEVVRNVIVNKRKLQLLESLEQNLLEDALDKQEFEVY